MEFQKRMEVNKHKIPVEVYKSIVLLDVSELTEKRRSDLIPMIEYVQQKNRIGAVANLNFICTHNSRRSQLAQVWAHTMANLFGIEAACFSGGVEITAFNNNAVQALESSGFKFEKAGDENPTYAMSLNQHGDSLVCFSKLFDSESNPKSNFAAIMVCADADQNCPFIPGCEKRIGLPYQDPKHADGTAQEKEIYLQRSLEIAIEMKYVFSQISLA